MFKWWHEFKRKDIQKRIPGLALKQATIQMKIDSAMRVLNRREKDVPVDVERRLNDDLEYHLKNA